MTELLTAFKGIDFIEENHTYFKDNIKLISTTTFLKDFSPEFKADYWLTYKALERKGHKPRPDNTRTKLVIDKRSYSPAEANKKFTLDSIVKEIRDEWDSARIFGVEKGNFVHNYLENRWNRKIVVYDGWKNKVDKSRWREFELEIRILKRYADSFYNDHLHLIPIRTEFVLGDIEYGIAGQLDLLAYDPIAEEFIIFDYKTDKEINSTNKWDNLKGSLSHLPSCELVKYSLQTGIYKEILQKNTKIKVSKIKIVWFSVNNDNYKIINTIDLEADCKKILKNGINSI
jgi:hypothetical protein